MLGHTPEKNSQLLFLRGGTHPIRTDYRALVIENTAISNPEQDQCPQLLDIVSLSC
jgi:hypothetical protein